MSAPPRPRRELSCSVPKLSHLIRILKLSIEQALLNILKGISHYWVFFAWIHCLGWTHPEYKGTTHSALIVLSHNDLYKYAGDIFGIIDFQAVELMKKCMTPFNPYAPSANKCITPLRSQSVKMRQKSIYGPGIDRGGPQLQPTSRTLFFNFLKSDQEIWPKKQEQSHFWYYLQNRSLKFCIEDVYTPLPPPKKNPSGSWLLNDHMLKEHKG